MLAGMDYDFRKVCIVRCQAIMLGNGAGNSSSLNELRPGAYDGGDFHWIRIILL